MDWTADLERRFRTAKSLQDLKKEEFYGNVQINFNKGNIISISKYETFRAKSEYIT